MNGFVKNANATFVASFNEYPEEVIQQIKEKTLYVSSFDNI